MRIKGKKTMKVLEFLGEGALEMADIWLAITTAPYGSSHSRLQAQKMKIEKARKEIFENIKERENLYNLIINLRKQGLVSRKEKTGKKFWQLTPKGEKELKKLKAYYRKNNLPERKYSSDASDAFTIIIFDVPEKERRKRDWLRKKLVEMKFKKLQGSVWIGKYRVPEQFLKDLNESKLIECVEIFTVGKAGTLKKLS